MSRFHTIIQKGGTIKRVPKGDPPFVQLDLLDGQYVTSVTLEEIRQYDLDVIDRKTSDWRWSAFVVTPL